MTLARKARQITRRARNSAALKTVGARWTSYLRHIWRVLPGCWSIILFRQQSAARMADPSIASNNKDRSSGRWNSERMNIFCGVVHHAAFADSDARSFIATGD